MTVTTEVGRDDKPPAWANSLMRWALEHPRDPGDVGKRTSVARLHRASFRKTYIIPVSHHWEDDIVTVITK